MNYRAEGRAEQARIDDYPYLSKRADQRAQEEGYADMYSWPCEHRWINRPYLTALPVCERCGEWQS